MITIPIEQNNGSEEMRQNRCNGSLKLAPKNCMAGTIGHQTNSLKQFNNFKKITRLVHLSNII